MDSKKFIFIETPEGRELSYPRQKGEPFFDELSVDYCSVKKYLAQFKSGNLQNEYFSEVLCVNKGSFVLQQSEQKVWLKEDQALFVPQGVPFCIENDSKSEGQIYRLGFHGGQIEKLLNAARLDNKQPVCRNVSSKDIYKSIDTILDSRNDGVLGAAIRAREILEVVILLMETAKKERDISQNRTNNIYVQSAVNFINNHYGENIDVQSIADSLDNMK